MSKKSISHKKQKAEIFKIRAEGWAAILTALRTAIVLVILLGFIVVAPKLGVDLKSLQPDVIAPIVTSLMK